MLQGREGEGGGRGRERGELQFVCAAARFAIVVRMWKWVCVSTEFMKLSQTHAHAPHYRALIGDGACKNLLSVFLKPTPDHTQVSV